MAALRGWLSASLSFAHRRGCSRPVPGEDAVRRQPSHAATVLTAALSSRTGRPNPMTYRPPKSNPSIDNLMADNSQPSRAVVSVAGGRGRRHAPSPGTRVPAVINLPPTVITDQKRH